MLTARDETIARIIEPIMVLPSIFWLRVDDQDIRLDTLTLDDNPVAADFVYDDVLLVTLNDAVVIASYAPILEQLEQTDGLYRYVWDDSWHPVTVSVEFSVLPWLQ